MRLFNNRKETKIELPEGSECCRCGKKIRGTEFVYIDGKVYCRKCYQEKRDWEFLEFHALFDE